MSKWLVVRVFVCASIAETQSDLMSKTRRGCAAIRDGKVEGKNEKLFNYFLRPRVAPAEDWHKQLVLSISTPKRVVGRTELIARDSMGRERDRMPSYNIFPNALPTQNGKMELIKIFLSNRFLFFISLRVRWCSLWGILEKISFLISLRKLEF